MVPTRKSASPPAPTELPTAPATPLDSPCAHHEQRDAVAVCDRCGDFICLLCLTPFEGRGYCLNCFELLWSRGEFGRRKETWRGWENPATAWLLAAIAWILVLPPFLSWLPAIGAILIGFAALKRIRLEPERAASRGTAIGAMVAAGLATLASTAITLAFFW